MEKEEKKKTGRPATGRTQKHISFRCDLDNIKFLETKPNKGGFINKLIRAAAHGQIKIEDCGDMPTDPEDIKP